MLDPQGSKGQRDPMVCCGRRLRHVRSIGPFAHYYECAAGCGYTVAEVPGEFLRITEGGVSTHVVAR